ncbi:hypothetical protein, partial [Escherichia coli]|uniref:hypothetical protein n=1 Tax=Escherichia coli TaxID=562 RepID=UPI002270ED80
LPRGNRPTLPGAAAAWESAHLAGRRCRVEIRPSCRARLPHGNAPTFLTEIKKTCQMTGSKVLVYVRRDFTYRVLRTKTSLNHQYGT